MAVNADVVIDAMSIDDLATALDWAAAEGWNPGLSDVRSFHAADPSGFLAARLDGRMVGSVSAVKSGADFGFIGMFIVVPELRGAGIGMRLWDAGMARLAGRVVGLDGVVEMQDAYARSGFVLEYRNLRYSGSLADVPAVASDAIALGPRDLDAVFAYDSPCFGSDRREFLSAWLAQPNAYTCGVVRDSVLAGYGTIRQAREGWKVGPLFADDIDVARQVLAAFRREVGDGATVALDVPQPHAAACAIAEQLGMDVSFETARMYAGGRPELPIDRIFGVTSFELG